ncbi:hypothetical protein SNEBB_003510, partial [Seison nebaliae]
GKAQDLCIPNNHLVEDIDTSHIKSLQSTDITDVADSTFDSTCIEQFNDAQHTNTINAQHTNTKNTISTSSLIDNDKYENMDIMVEEINKHLSTLSDNAIEMEPNTDEWIPITCRPRDKESCTTHTNT